jgi:hypothetical protein
VSKEDRIVGDVTRGQLFDLAAAVGVAMADNPERLTFYGKLTRQGRLMQTLEGIHDLIADYDLASAEEQQ